MDDKSYRRIQNTTFLITMDNFCASALKEKTDSSIRELQEYKTIWNEIVKVVNESADSTNYFASLIFEEYNKDTLIQVIVNKALVEVSIDTYEKIISVMSKSLVSLGFSITYGNNRLKIDWSNPSCASEVIKINSVHNEQQTT